MTTTIAARRFWLGSMQPSGLSLYTALAPSAAIEDALGAQRARPARNPSDVIVEEMDLERYGVAVGVEHVVRSAVTGVAL